MLTTKQYEATQEESMDQPQTGNTYNNEYGTYHCVVCDQMLFNSHSKAVVDRKELVGLPIFLSNLLLLF